VKNVVFVTAPGVTAIPYLLVDNFSLGKIEIEWARVFYAGGRIRDHESLGGRMVVVAAPADGLPGRRHRSRGRHRRPFSQRWVTWQYFFIRDIYYGKMYRY
jgi:hypothetical protein